MIKKAGILVALASVATVVTGCGGTAGSSSMPTTSAATSSVPSVSVTAPTSAVPATSYAVDQGWGGTACVLPVAAVEAIFGPLDSITNPNVTVIGGYVEMATNNNLTGDAGCSEIWYPQAYPNYGQSVNIGFATDGPESYKTDLTVSKWVPVPGGLTGEEVGTDSDPHDSVLVVPSSDGYVYLGLSSDTTSQPVSVADGTKALRVIIDVAKESPPQGLRGIADLP